MTTIKMKQGDLSPTFATNLLDGSGDYLDLTNASSVTFRMFGRDRVLKVNNTATVSDAATGAVQYAWQSGDTDTSDIYNVEWEILWAGGAPETVPNSGHDKIVISRQGG